MLKVVTIQKSVKVRIYPKESDKELLSKHFGAKRFIYNKFLELRQKEFIENKVNLDYYKCSALVTKMKKEPNLIWLNEINSQTIQSSIKDLQGAYDKFFKKLTKFPKFKSKRDSKQSFNVPQSFKINWQNKTIKIPKFKQSFKFKGTYSGTLLKVNSVTISKDAVGNYFASIQGMFEIPQKDSTGEIIGVDLGIKSLLVTSNGDEIKNERFLKQHLKKLKFKQRSYSKKKKDTSSQNAARIILAKQHQKVVNRRNNYLHQISSKLINDNQVIVLEDLAVKNMIKNHCLAQSISDVSWGKLVSMITYKAAWHGRQVIKVDRWFPSSKMCSSCNNIVVSMPLNVREWTCSACHTHHDRDVNAAKNILRQGLNLMSGLGTKSDFKQKQAEALTHVRSMKSENPHSLDVD